MLRALAAVSLLVAFTGCRHAPPILDLASPDALSVLRFATALNGEFDQHPELPESMRSPEGHEQSTHAALNFYADAFGFARPFLGPDLPDFLKAQPLRFEHVGMLVSAVQTAIKVAELAGPLLKIYADLALMIPQMLIYGLK